MEDEDVAVETIYIVGATSQIVMKGRSLNRKTRTGQVEGTSIVSQKIVMMKGKSLKWKTRTGQD